MQFEGRQAPDGQRVLAAPRTDRVGVYRRQLGERPVGQRPQRQQLFARRGAASVIAVHLRRKNRMRRNSHGIATNRIGGAATAIASTHASHDAVVSRLCPAPAMSSAASLAARSGAAQRIADQRDVVGAVTRRVEVVGDAVGPGLDLTAHRGDGRDRGVHGHADQQPDDGPDRDDDVADQLRQQSAGRGGVGDKPGTHGLHAAR